MRIRGSLGGLWVSARSRSDSFGARQVSGLSDGARRYLAHAISPGTPLASAVHLRMHGEIKLKGWWRFSAEEVISWGSGFIWRAAARMGGISIRGSDSFVLGQGRMRWRLFGIVPVVNAGGPDITRSAAGRVNIESIWLPSALCSEDVSWRERDSDHPRARFTAHNETAEIDYAIGEQGELLSVSMPRWGNSDGAGFAYASFGARVDDEATFGGYTIPTRLRAGWHFNTDRFDSEGEFFRVMVDDAVYR